MTQKRLITYPRIIVATIWLITAANILFHQGWQGGMGQIIATDFITLYSSGLTSRQDVGHLYDPAVQLVTQQKLVAPTVLRGLNPYISPPYVALAYSLLTILPLLGAVLLWSAVSLGLVIPASQITGRLLAARRSHPGWLNPSYVALALLSFYPFVMGWQVGQNHSLTLLLVCGVLSFSLTGHWGKAGLLAGLMIYKPQFCLGFLILWLVWRKARALGGFALVTLAWIGTSILVQGPRPLQEYLRLVPAFSLISYIPGFPGSLSVTPHALLASFMPLELGRYLLDFDRLALIGLSAALAGMAYRLRNAPHRQRWMMLPLAALFPLLASPYALVHDLVILAPILALWYRLRPEKQTGELSGPGLFAVGIYLAGLVLPILSYAAHIAFLAVLPLWVAAAMLAQVTRSFATHPAAAGTRSRGSLSSG